MKTATVAGITLAALCGCAQTTGLSSTTAEQQCGALARSDGLRVAATRPAGDTGNVQMRLEDKLGRQFDASCAFSTANGARWATPLPANAARR